MNTTTNPIERETPPVRDKGGAIFLFARDLRWTWPSYVAATLLGAVSGAVASNLPEGIFVIEGLGEEGESVERVSNSLLADFWFLGLTPAFMINFVFNRDYAARFTQDNMSRRLSFLRSLPIPVRDLVLGRALSALLSLVLSATPFFGALYLLSDTGGGRLLSEVYLPFAAIWIAYALVMGGFYLYAWLGFSSRMDVPSTLVVMASLLLVPAVCNLVLGIGLVGGSLGLPRDYGPLVAAALVPPTRGLRVLDASRVPAAEEEGALDEPGCGQRKESDFGAKPGECREAGKARSGGGPHEQHPSAGET